VQPDDCTSADRRATYSLHEGRGRRTIGRARATRLRLGGHTDPPRFRRGPARLGLARRSISDPTGIAYYVCYGPRGIRLREPVRVAGTRWSVEELFQTAKNENGLDHYQVRRYDAW
jgi:hypothetical protein